MDSRRYHIYNQYLFMINLQMVNEKNTMEMKEMQTRRVSTKKGHQA